MDNAHFRHALELYAIAKGFELSPHADKIINRCLNSCDGCCPCDVSRGLCPCGEHEKEIAAGGKCHCTLLMKKKDSE